MYTVNLSYKGLKDNVTENYEKTLRGFKNKNVLLEDIHKLMLNSKIQYSNLKWNNGHKGSKQLDATSVDCIICDLDDGLSIASFQSIFKKYTYFLGTTKSHQKEKKGLTCDRYRVLMPVINISKDFDVLMRAIELIVPTVDRQTLTKTGAYLGNDMGIYIENKGTILDMHKANELAREQLKAELAEEANKIKVPKELMVQHSGNSIDLDDIKDRLTSDITREILTDIGLEFEGYKCSLRDERTKSAKIYGYYIKDYGDDEMSGDIFDVLMRLEGLSFREAIKYVAQYI